MSRAAPAILITGASSGLGAGLAKSYARPDVTLWLVGRDPERLNSVAAACRALGATVQTGEFDVGHEQPFGAWLLAADDATPLDIILACAGVSAGPLPDGTPEGVALAALQVRSNLLGVINTVEPLLPRMLVRKDGQIAVVSSVAGLRGLPFSPGYSASKAGVRAYGEGLRAFVATRGIAVSVIVPGFFDTPMTDRFIGSKPFMALLPSVVTRIRRGLDRRRPRIVFPTLLALGLVAADLMPAWMGDRILRSVPFHIKAGR
jgi:short-subunit dehydrogenase